jgi:TorA maturation chaperone TorD
MIDAGNGHIGAAAALAAARARAYEVLATLYLNPPTEQLVDGLLKLSTSPVMADPFGGPATECLRRCAAAHRGELDALRQEFDDLFVVPLGRYVTPYEAVYRDQRVVGDTVVGGLLMGASTVAVMSEYRAAGVEVSSACGELPDHIGVELSFMAFLCAHEEQSWNAGEHEGARSLLHRQKRFLGQHLLQWAPALSSRIIQVAQSDFYRAIALLTEDFLRADAAILAGSLEDMDPIRREDRCSHSR